MEYSGRKARLLKGSGGFTLTELVVVLALLGVVLTGAYQYFFFSHASWGRAAAESRAIQDARLVVMRMSREVREARKATLADNAVVVAENGARLDIYTDVTGDGRPELVRYRLHDGGLQRGMSAPTGTEFPYTYSDPSDFEVVVPVVLNASVFSLDTSHLPRLKVTVNLQVDDAEASLNWPLGVRAELTVRSRGRAE